MLRCSQRRSTSPKERLGIKLKTSLPEQVNSGIRRNTNLIDRVNGRRGFCFSRQWENYYRAAKLSLEAADYSYHNDSKNLDRAIE
jgi:hypothetical protein